MIVASSEIGSEIGCDIGGVSEGEDDSGYKFELYESKKFKI